MVFEGDPGFLNHPVVESAKNYNGMAEIRLREGGDAQLLLADAVSKARITRFEVMEPTLEEIFIETVGDRVDA
jgi:ABC-2 type transport system ATP-binding protein